MKVGGNTVWFAVSFHTHQLAWFDNRGNGRYALIINDLDSGRQTRSVSLPAGIVPRRGLSWAPDDQHLFFLVRGDKSDEIWRCGLDGSPPVKVVEVLGHQVATVLTSPGGKRLGFHKRTTGFKRCSNPRHRSIKECRSEPGRSRNNFSIYLSFQLIKYIS